MIQIKILYNDGILLPKIVFWRCIYSRVSILSMNTRKVNNTSKELLEQFFGWEEEERGYLTFVKKEVSLFPRDLKNRIGAPLAESLVVEKMQAANYTSRYAFYRPVYRICSIKPLIPRALTDTGFYYVALATKSYKGLCSRSPVGATASFHGVITRTAFSGIHPPPPPLLVLSLFSSSIVVK